MLKGLEAAAAIGLSGTNSKYPGKCIDDDTSLPHSLATSWQMKDTCGQKTCVQRGGNLYISYETCGYAQIAPGCYTRADLSQEYPACCPRIVCEEEENQEKLEVPNKVQNINNNNQINSAVNFDIDNEINSDEYGFYDVSSYDDLYMMPSDESPVYDVVLPPSSGVEVPAPFSSGDFYAVWKSLSTEK